MKTTLTGLDAWRDKHTLPLDMNAGVDPVNHIVVELRRIYANIWLDPATGQNKIDSNKNLKEEDKADLVAALLQSIRAIREREALILITDAALNELIILIQKDLKQI